MFFKFSASTVLGVLISSLAFADQMGPNGDKFYEEAAHYENSCQEGVCNLPYSEQVVFDLERDVNKLPPTEQESLRNVAFDQAQIWGDTILEGDYVADGQTRLDKVLAFYKDNQLVGYKIQYSEKAWYTGDCNYDGKEESLNNCQDGRIEEGSYVSADMQTYISDEERYAEFSFNAK